MTRRLLNVLMAAVCACAIATGVSSPAGAAAPEPEIIPIDLIQAGSYTAATRDAIKIWNQAVPQIKFVEQSTPAALRVQAYTSTIGTSSHSALRGLGRGSVFLETGDAKIYRPTRVVVHELGHILSLADLGPGSLCSKIMSGAWAGSECLNDHPDSEETAAVAAFFATHNVGDPVPGWGSLSRG
ncbi:snapalysin family zinc-dependent metalloprotease [Streptomyces liangshanensis]|uniref:Extracellular small neutral protease n=1 Tax=Streptomyces liangshanensis TaxID=2717324 RepID=A0A6G9H9N7_9ACTN|nr:snapalysin family zinc-dependent metalloprotease [Streptomyces liangshanensis]